MAKKNAKTAKKPHPQNPVVRAAFATIIRQLRRKLKLSQKQVAARSALALYGLPELQLKRREESVVDPRRGCV